MFLKRTTAMFLAMLMLAQFGFAGVAADKAKYVGGTATITKDKEAQISVADENVMTFADWKLPYDKVTAISYGQHAGRRVGTTVALGITTLGVGALPILFSKKRRHYLTVEYTDDAGKTQAAIWEVGKDSIRTVMKTLEVRTGKKVEYEDEEARKTGNK
jgi:hypothetical protein